MPPHTALRVAFSRPWPGTRRGLCLWLFSLAFICIGGINYVFTEPPEITREALTFATEIAPLQFWGCIMISAGAIAFFSSYCHFGRDRYGYTLLATFCGGWALVYWCGWVFFDASLRAVSGSLIWVLFSAILTLLAGFPNVQLRTPPLIRGDDE